MSMNDAAGSAEAARVRLRWDETGAGEPFRLGRAQRRLLRAELGVEPDEPVDRADAAVRVPAGRLDAAALTALRAVVGAGNVHTDAAERLGHAGGMSYLDLVHRREDTMLPAPDAVVAPADHDEVVGLLGVAERCGLAVVPYGGGTSVVGGVNPPEGGRPVLALDLGRMTALVAVDEVSATATLQPGLTGPEAERLLGEHGLTLGHFPQSWELSTVGGWLATRSAGQASTGFGRVDDLVVGLRVATPRGTLELGRAPRSAAGPDLRELFVGSEGAFGVITEATLRVRPVPTVRRYLGWSFPGLDAGLTALRRLVQEGVAPDVLRLSDAEETRVTLALAGRSGRAVRAYQRLRGHGEPCLAVTGWEGTSRNRVRARQAAADEVLRAAGGVPLGAKVGEAWRHGRYAAPRQRDVLLDLGVLAETLETATSWTRLAELHEKVAAAIRTALDGAGTPPVVMAHVSHAYPTGASLYVTVLARRTDDTAAQWWSAKRAALDAITEVGGTITHHHAVGRDHVPWLADEVGPLGVDVLRAVKQCVDPAGVLNPGVLVPEPDRQRRPEPPGR
ncbi:MAG TPA: FAD-binding oxidoreductase [Streptosporangiales bacterium]